VESIKNQKFIKDLKTILNGSATSSNKKGVLQTLGTCYTYMEELTGLFEKLGLHPKRMKAQTILAEINKLEAISKTKPFLNGNLIMEESLATVVSAAFLEMPFLHFETSTLEEAVKVAQILQLDRLFEVQPTMAIRCGVLTCSTPKEMELLLKDKTFQMLIGCNIYQGIHWYRGEAFQECLYLNVLSKALINPQYSSKEAEEELEKWLTRSAKASYKLNNLENDV
jgi:hypothetical protein